MKAIAIDLDDTLYNEIDYVFSGYDEVATWLAQEYKLNKIEVLDQIMYNFYKYGRLAVFDNTKKYFNIIELDNKYLVQIYRNHIPKIKLFDGVEKVLGNLRKEYKIGLVTDGNIVSQTNKVVALGLDKMFDEIIYCAEYESKPSILPYKVLVRKLNVSLENLIIVGDDPFADIMAARKANIQSYRIVSGKYREIRSQAHAMPTATFNSFVEFGKYIGGYNAGLY